MIGGGASLALEFCGLNKSGVICGTSPIPQESSYQHRQVFSHSPRSMPTTSVVRNATSAKLAFYPTRLDCMVMQSADLALQCMIPSGHKISRHLPPFLHQKWLILSTRNLSERNIEIIRLMA